MKVIIAKHLRADFESVAANMVKSGATSASVREFVVIQDGSPKYKELAADPSNVIFYTFAHAGGVFHVMLE
jgi:hypothetical protein